MIKGIGITIVIDEIKEEEDVLLLQQAITGVLPETSVHQTTEVYTKFRQAYKLEYFIPAEDWKDKANTIYHLLKIADTIARPWLLYFDGEGDNTELLFNRNEQTHVSKAAFYSIRWAHIQLIY